MRPGVPGQLQLNPFKVRTASMQAGLKQAGKMPKIAGIYPGMKLGGPMMMPGLAKMPMVGRLGGAGMGMGMPRLPGLAMPKMPGMGFKGF